MNTQSKGLTRLLQWGCLTLLLSSIVIVAAAGGWLLTKGAPRPSGPRPTAIIWTATATPTPTVTPIPQPTRTPSHLPDTIGIGMRVSIGGTGAAGLSIRAAANTTAERLYIAAEGDRFVVIDGPVSADDFTWWKLRSEAGSEPEGWAVADYLILIGGE